MNDGVLGAKRYRELDLARAVPLFGLPFTHFYEEFAGYFCAESVGASWGNILIYLCMIGPSVFMMCLGMNLVFSTHSSPKELARRGLITIALYYALNLLLTYVPAGITALCGYPEEFEELAEYFLGSDILFFAGLTFLFFALMKRLRVRPFYILLLSLVFLTVNTLVSEPEIPSAILGSFLGNFIYVNEYSSFPFLSWLIFPSVGYCMGHALLRMEDTAQKRGFYRDLLLGCSVGFVAACVCIASYGLDPLVIASSPANSYITDLANVVLDLLVSGLWFGAAYFISNWIRSERVHAVIRGFSRSILLFYCVQWIIVVWLWYALVCFGLKYAYVFNEASFFITATAVAAASLAVTFLIQRAMDARAGRKRMQNAAR